jgi:hypothetical protein
MQRDKLVRWLRIALSVWWGILCVLLVVLWVRSYHYSTQYQHSFSTTHCVTSETQVGTVYISWRVGNSNKNLRQGFIVREIDDATRATLERIHSQNDTLGFAFGHRAGPPADIRGMTLPYWFLVLLTATLAPLPWFPWKYSLRTLLIATTLIAIVLGLVVWSSS